MRAGEAVAHAVTGACRGDAADEGELVRRARLGDGEAFAQLVRHHEDAVHRLALRMVGPDQAEDMVQQAFLKAWQGLDRFGGESRFGTWVYRIAMNLCLDHLRRAGRFRPLPLEDVEHTVSADDDVAESVEAAIEQDVRTEALSWALERAPSEDRLLLHLRVAEGLGYEAIAERLGTNPRTVGTRLFRARARLHTLITRRLAVALLAMLLVAGAASQPAAWANVGLLLQQVVVRESAPPAEPTRALQMARVSLDEAQLLASWHIRRPASLPDGYRLVDVYAGEIHAFAIGPTIVLHYQQGDGPTARHLGLTQLRAATDVPEDIEPGAARQIAVGAGVGLFVDGRWVDQGGRRTWERGTLARLIVEQGDLVIQLEADPRDGWDAEHLAAVAASLRR